MKALVAGNLKVMGEPAPRTSSGTTPLGATLRVNKNLFDREYPFVIKDGGTAEPVTITGHTSHSAPVRKMEHLSRVKTANFGISTMDSPYIVSEDTDPLILDKPHFILCGVPMGSKEIDHHLYLSEARVGNYKTTAKALYDARRGARSGKAYSEPIPLSEREIYSETDEMGLHGIPPIPPTTPINFVPGVKTKSASSAKSLELQGQKVHTTKSAPDWEHCNPNQLFVRHKKINLLQRDDMSESSHQRPTTCTTSHGSIAETVHGSVVNNSMTVSTGYRKHIKPYVKEFVKINYNNPYRNSKHLEKAAFASDTKLEFNSVDSYMNYHRTRAKNGKQILAPRAVIRVPKPCSDTFLLQMMYDLNRPKSRRSGQGTTYSDIAVTRDLEEYVQARTSSSLSKAQSNIDRFQGRKSGKSVKSGKSSRSFLDTDTIEEESKWDVILREETPVRNKNYIEAASEFCCMNGN